MDYICGKIWIPASLAKYIGKSLSNISAARATSSDQGAAPHWQLARGMQSREGTTGANTTMPTNVIQ